jgi:branched-chain amino acid transport system permease protein
MGLIMEKREFILRVIISMIFLLVIIPVILLVIQRNDYLYGITSVAILATISAGVWLTFYMGRINIGQGAYALIGAYTTAVLVVQYDISFWIALFVSGFVAAFFSVLIGFPILRLKGVYFSMVTLTLTEVVRLIAIALVPLTNGPRGITNIPLPGELTLFGITIIPDFATLQNSKIAFYYLAVIVMIIAFAIVYRLVNSRMGILLKSLQQNEELASSFGVNIAYLRIISYAISSFLGGIGGAIFINLTQSVYPTTFQVADSINYMLYTFLGGLAYVFGPILGAFVLYFSWDILFVFKEYQLLIYSSIIILLMLFLPNGILSLRLKK